MTLLVRAAWTAGYLGLALLPLGAAALADPFPAPRDIWLELGVALGYLAFALLLLQFALVSRFGPAARPFGADALMQWHRGMAFVAIVFALGHVSWAPGASWWAAIPGRGPLAWQAGAVSLWAAGFLVVTSVLRRRLRLPYEAWQAAHLALACLLAVALVSHVLAAGAYAASPAVRWVVAGYLGLFLGLLARYRVVRPLRMLARPWSVVSNTPLGARTTLVRLRPVEHDGIAFEPGQFAWLVTGRSPLVSEQHPLSIASSAAPVPGGEIEFAVKALGDWSRTVVPSLRTGSRVFVDGAFGGFTPGAGDRHGLVLIAGGIGIAPMRSMLLTMRDRGERRPTWLFYAASNWRTVAFREELDRLAGELDLCLVYVLEDEETQGPHEPGRLSHAIFDRHLPADRVACEYFVCGPVPMMDSVERDLRALGVPLSRIHTERFQMV